MKVCMILFPGSNCDKEAVAFLSRTYGPVDTVWHRDRFDHTSFDLVFLPGGFSYGDYIRAGACGARSPAMGDVYRMAKRGALVIGVCNGFQILLERGLLPGVLIPNPRRRFVCQWVDVHVTQDSVLNWDVPGGAVLRLPIANTYGRYYLPRQDLLPEQIVLRYGMAAKKEAAQEGVAGVTNQSGNVLGLMPHPERAWAGWHPSQDGVALMPG